MKESKLKRLFRKRKLSKIYEYDAEYGEYSIACIYHDNFIKLQNTILTVLEEPNTIEIPEVYSIENLVSTKVKGETVSLNRSNGIFKESVLYNIKEDSFILEKGRNRLEEFGTMVIEVSITTSFKSIRDLVDIYEILNINKDISQTIINNTKENITILLYGNIECFSKLRGSILYDNIKENNRLIRGIIDIVRTTIPKPGDPKTVECTYFTAMNDRIPKKIFKYKRDQAYVQVLSYDTFEEIEMINNTILDTKVPRYIYLLIDNPAVFLELSEEKEMANISEAYLYQNHNPDIDRVVLKVDICELYRIIEILDDINGIETLIDLSNILTNDIKDQLLNSKEIEKDNDSYYIEIDEVLD